MKIVLRFKEYTPFTMESCLIQEPIRPRVSPDDGVRVYHTTSADAIGIPLMGFQGSTLDPLTPPLACFLCGTRDVPVYVKFERYKSSSQVVLFHLGTSQVHHTVADRSKTCCDGGPEECMLASVEPMRFCGIRAAHTEGPSMLSLSETQTSKVA